MSARMTGNRCPCLPLRTAGGPGAGLILLQGVPVYKKWSCVGTRKFSLVTCVYAPFMRNLTTCNDAGTPANTIIFVKDMDFVNDRLTAAEPFVVKEKSV